MRGKINNMTKQEEKLLQAKKFLKELYADEPQLEIFLAVALPDPAEEDENNKSIGFMMHGRDEFSQQIILFLAERSKNVVTLEMPLKELFPPTNPKDIN